MYIQTLFHYPITLINLFYLYIDCTLSPALCIMTLTTSRGFSPMQTKAANFTPILTDKISFCSYIFFFFFFLLNKKMKPEINPFRSFFSIDTCVPSRPAPPPPRLLPGGRAIFGALLTHEIGTWDMDIFLNLKRGHGYFSLRQGDMNIIFLNLTGRQQGPPSRAPVIHMIRLCMEGV